MFCVAPIHPSRHVLVPKPNDENVKLNFLQSSVTNSTIDNVRLSSCSIHLLFLFCGVGRSKLGHKPEAVYSQSHGCLIQPCKVCCRGASYIAHELYQPRQYHDGVVGLFRMWSDGVEYRIFPHAVLVAPATFHESFTRYRSAVTYTKAL